MTMRLLVLGQHPALHSGFAVIGCQIATQLQAQGWQVDYLGRGAPAPNPGPFPFQVHDVDPRGDFTDARLHDGLRQLVREAAAAHPLTLLSIGTAADHHLLLDLLAHLGLRQRVRVVTYLPVDFAPLRPLVGHLLKRADLVVPYTRYAVRVLEAWCRRAAVSTASIAPPIPHGVGTEVFRPPAAELRSKVRRELFGLEKSDLLVGYFGRNSAHKHPDLALRIFAHFAQGRYGQCKECGHLDVCAHAPLDLSACSSGTCTACGGVSVQGVAAPGARLYLHTDLHSGVALEITGGWDLELLARRLGIADRVLWNRELRCRRGVPAPELALRMGACDLHLLPYDSGGWELTVLETAACGVANVITDIAAPPEYAAPFSVLVPVGTAVLAPTCVRGLMDIGEGVAALVSLSRDPDMRTSLGQAGVRVAAALSWPRVVEQWHELLRRLTAN